MVFELEKKRARIDASSDIAMQEWEKAEAYFADKANHIVKYRRKDSGLSHSFIKIDGKIYLISHLLLGAGTYSKIKLAFDKSGKEVALNIKTYIETAVRDAAPERELLSVMGRFFGSVRRASATTKAFFLEQLTGLKKTMWSVFFATPPTLEKFYMATEAVDGMTLEAALLEGMYQDSTEALILAFRMAKALYELHDKYGYLHCDIKPSNIMVSGSGASIKVTLIDFGFSQKRDISEVTRLQVRMGTNNYMAREIKNDLANHAIYSVRSDVYALGVTFGILRDLNQGFLTRHLYKSTLEESPFHEDFIFTLKTMGCNWPYNYQVKPPKPLRPNSFEVCYAILLQLRMLPETPVLQAFFQHFNAEVEAQLKEQEHDKINSSFSGDFVKSLKRMIKATEKVARNYIAESLKPESKAPGVQLDVPIPPPAVQMTNVLGDVQQNAEVIQSTTSSKTPPPRVGSSSTHSP